MALNVSSCTLKICITSEDTIDEFYVLQNVFGLNTAPRHLTENSEVNTLVEKD